MCHISRGDIVTFKTCYLVAGTSLEMREAFKTSLPSKCPGLPIIHSSCITHAMPTFPQGTPMINPDYVEHPATR